MTDVGLVELSQRCPLLEEILADIKFILPSQPHFREWGEGKSAQLRTDMGIGAQPDNGSDGGTGASGGSSSGDSE